ncbi:MAG: hypothetical protein C0624_04775, partial [Desulfuromonas sp.]
LRAHYVKGTTHRRQRTIVINVRREEDETLKQLIDCILKVYPPDALAEIGYDHDVGLESLRIT